MYLNTARFSKDFQIVFEYVPPEHFLPGLPHRMEINTALFDDVNVEQVQKIEDGVDSPFEEDGVPVVQGDTDGNDDNNKSIIIKVEQDR